MNATTDSSDSSSSSSSSSSLSDAELLTILLPIIVASVFSFVSWYVRGYIEKNNKAKDRHHDAKKKFLIENLANQITKFYWPIFLNLARYKLLIDRYTEFKAGHFSLNSSQKDTKSSGEGRSMATLKKSPQPDIIIKIDDSKQDLKLDRDDKIDKKDDKTDKREVPKFDKDDKINGDDGDSDSSNYKDIPHNDKPMVKEGGGMGLKNAIKIINKYNQAMNEYQIRMINTLKEIQKIYTEFAPISEPDVELFRELMKLDEYITYLTTFADIGEKNSTDSFIEDKIEKTKFPQKVFSLIGAQLHYLQELYNDLIYNQHSHLLTSEKETINTDVTEVAKLERQAKVRNNRLSIYKAHMPEDQVIELERKMSNHKTNMMQKPPSSSMAPSPFMQSFKQIPSVPPPIPERV